MLIATPKIRKFITLSFSVTVLTASIDCIEKMGAASGQAGVGSSVYKMKSRCVKIEDSG